MLVDPKVAFTHRLAPEAIVGLLLARREVSPVVWVGSEIMTEERAFLKAILERPDAASTPDSAKWQARSFSKT